jgi:hypothetical protein
MFAERFVLKDNIIKDLCAPAVKLHSDAALCFLIHVRKKVQQYFSSQIIEYEN